MTNDAFSFVPSPPKAGKPLGQGGIAMGEVINLHDKLRKSPDNLICLRPWEFRRAAWETTHFVQMLRSLSAKLERNEYDNQKRGSQGIGHLPAHFSLKGGMAYTIRAMYSNREDEGKMREVYYLMGLMDCMINQVNPILRTDLLRAMYKKVFTMKEKLNIHWYGPLDHVLLPIDCQFHNGLEYRSSLNRARTMKALLQAIRKGTDHMFEILSLEYVFYFPGIGG
jgi:hypothetical protein